MNMQRSKERRIRRLLAGLFCICLILSDLTPWGMQVLAQEDQRITENAGQQEADAAGQQENAGKEGPQSEDGNSGIEDDDPDAGNGEGDEQDPQDGNVIGEEQDTDDGNAPEEGDSAGGTDESGVDQQPGGADDTDAEEGSEEGEEAEKEQTPDETEDTVSENSVSENDAEVTENAIFSVMTQSGDIASGGWKIEAGSENGAGSGSWVIDANGKLLVNGIGEFSDWKGVPWDDYSSQIRTAEIHLSGKLDASGMFSDCENMTSVDLRGFDTSGVYDMNAMFYDCSSLTELDLSRFDTRQVGRNPFTDKAVYFPMSNMFAGCSALKSLDLSSFNTVNVTDMSDMFSGCDNLESLDLSSFNTANVTDMSDMFSSCRKLQNLNLHNFNTANVTDMSRMFYGCSSLTSLDLSSFDTSNVDADEYNNGWGMNSMFEFCSSLTELDVSNFDTSNVKHMKAMFHDCSSLTSLDVSNFDTSNVSGGEDMYCMFADCSSLTSLDVSHFDTSNVSSMYHMFAGCSSLKSLDVSHFNTANVEELAGMFQNCSSLTNVDVSHFNTANVINFFGMFEGCSGLTSLDVSSFDTTAVSGGSSMGNMFKDCSGLTSLDVSSFNTAGAENMAAMFEGCSGLTSLDLSHFNTARVTSMTSMFSGCSSLTDLDVSSFDITAMESMFGMFKGCNSLEYLDLSSFDFVSFRGGNYDMLNAMPKLHTLYTPRNVAADRYISLPKLGHEGSWDRNDPPVWYDVQGNTYDELPKGLDHSILIEQDRKPETPAEGRLTVRKRKIAYLCGDALDTDDLTVTYYGADGSVRKLAASDGQTDGYITNAASLSTAQPGTLELVVTYAKDGKTLTGKVTLYVTYGLTVDNTTITLPAEDYTYDGQPKQPVPTAVSYTQNAAGGTGTPVTLSEGTDYTLSYRNNINAYKPSASDGSGAASGTGSGTAVPTVIIKGVGKYSGSVTKTFAIRKAEAPAAETMDVTYYGCEQAQTKRIDLTGSFAACGKKTGYVVTSVEDSENILSKAPLIAENGALTCQTRAADEGDTASIKLKISFQNYQDAELTVRITMAAKQAAVISGITMEKSVGYNGMPVSYSGQAVVKTEDGQDITGQVSLVYRYSGTMADGTAYPAQGSVAGGETGNGTGQEDSTPEAPLNAGSYTLTVSVSEDADYAGSVSYPFTIRKADAVVKARDMVVLMQLEGEGSTLVPVEQYQKDFGYTVTGLFNRDALTKEPSYKVTEDEAGAKTVTTIDTSKAGTYYIHPSGADAGMNYELAYRPGILTVSEERVAYTVTLDGMGHCDTFTKNGIKSGALLELTKEERTPEAKEQGYVFAGWFRDKTFDRKKEWNFDTDTVQSDLTLYACWMTAAGEDGAGLRLCVQEIPDLTYTGSAQKPAVTVYDSDGTTLLKAGKDYTVKYMRNTDAVAVDENGRPKEAGGTAKVVNPGKTNEQCTDVAGHFSKDCPYVVITGKGNYKETIYRNFLILPAQISGEDAAGKTVQEGDTPLAAGFTLKYTDQMVVNAKKEQKPFGSMKYKKGMKAGTDFTVTLGVADEEEAFDADKKPLAADWKVEGALNAKKQYTLPVIPKGHSGAFTLTVTGKGNYAGTVIRKLYVSDKQKLMKNATITLGKNQKTFAYTGEDVLLTPGYYDAEKKTYHKVTASGTVSSTAEANANDMFLVKAGKNGKAGGESLILGTDYTIDYAGTNRAVGTATMTLTGRNGYVGTKSVTFKITGTPFSTKTIDVRAYDAAHPNEKDWKASMPYTGRAVTQNQVTLATKATQKEPTSKELVYGEHYTIAYKNNVKKGTATMTFTAKPESGYSGSFKKTFKITAQELAKERLTVTTPVGGDRTPEADYSKNGAKLSFTITNEAGNVLREGTDYTVKYKNNNAVTTTQTPENKKPLMTVTGKGNYAGKVEVSFKVVQASLADALRDGTVTVSCVQVQKKNGMKFKDLKFKLVEGKKTLGMGETKDYVIDETGCTSEILKAYADAIAAGTALPKEPVVKVTGKGYYTGEKTIALGKYIYAEKLTAANVYVVVSEGAGQSIYTGGQVTPDVAVYYGEKTAVSAAKKDKVKDDAALTAQSGKYKLTRLAQKPSENAGDVQDADYTVSYGANVAAGKNKGSVTITGTGKYGGSVTVKFEIGKKAVYAEK